MKKILEYIKHGLILTLVLSVIYLVINIGVLIWFLINPEGFWGVIWFYTVFTGSLYVISQVLIVFVASIGHWGKKGLMYGIPLSILSMALAILTISPTLFIPKKLYNKYRYVERTEDYLTEGRYEKALEYAIDVYEENSNIKSSNFWFMKRIFLSTDGGIIYAKNIEYQAKLNYAICLLFTGIGESSDISERLFKECISLAKEFFPDKKDYLIAAKTSLSQLYMIQGRIYESEKIYNDLFTLSNSITEKDVYHIVDGLLNRSHYAVRFGDYKKAQEILHQARDIYLKSEKSIKSKYYLKLILRYINIKLDNEDIREIVDLLNEAKDITDENKKSIHYIDYLNYRARYEEYKGNNEEVVDLYEEALKRCKKKAPLEYATQLRKNGDFLFRKRDYKTALELYSKSFDILIDEQLGWFPSHYSSIIKTNFALGDRDLALRQSIVLDSLIIDNLNYNFITLSQNDRENLSYKYQNHFDISNSIFISTNEDIRVENVYDNILSTKSISLISNIHIQNHIRSIGNKDFQKSYNDLMIQKENIENSSVLNQNVSQQKQSEQNSLLFQEKEFNQSLIRQVGFKPFELDNVKWEDIKSKLDTDEVAIEFVNFQQSPVLKDSLIYYALIIHPTSTSPQCIKVCSENDIKKILTKHKKLETQVNSLYSSGSQSELYKLIWTPLTTHLENKNNVYISLSGLLNSISIPTLTIDEVYSVKVLSSTRQIVNLKNQESVKIKKSLVFGDIDYNTTTKNTSQLEITDSKIDISIYRNIEKSKLKHLAGTKIEVNFLQNLLEKNNIKSTIRRGDEASEDAFRSLIKMNKPDIIHIATHGFYYPKESSIVMKDNIFRVENDYSVIENPMLRSGLFFAGANNREKSSFNNDGIITANDIVSLDLSDVELVVLSACETGLGDVIGNEGVFGLQRAFKLAGANKIIMSLWKVPDDETAKLMTIFYRYYLVSNNAYVSLKKAQNEMRAIHPEPFYWAGFFVLE